MINHIVMWNVSDKHTGTERQEVLLKIKETLENLKGVIDEIVELKVVINELDSSNRDVALISKFKSMEDLGAYQVHPKHVEASKYVGSVTENRTCLDYNE